MTRYNRILLKLSGEALMGEKAYGTDPQVVQEIAGEIRDVAKLGVEMAVVVGGGNIFRGMAASAQGMDRSTADYVGMMATIMNAIILQEALEKLGVVTRVQSALHVKELTEPVIRRRALRHLEKGRVVIFAGGTGNPYCTTDTAAALRAAEMGAQVIFKATKVDGVYDADPKLHPEASKFHTISYLDVVQRGLKVMDTTAITMCMENQIPIVVFNLRGKGNLMRAVSGEEVGTLVAASQ